MMITDYGIKYKLHAFYSWYPGCKNKNGLSRVDWHSELPKEEDISKVVSFFTNNLDTTSPHDFITIHIDKFKHGKWIDAITSRTIRFKNNEDV